jgi:hypothetical protein
VLRARLRSRSSHESHRPICMKCVVPPSDHLGSLAELLSLFGQFLQESDLNAAQQCIDICESLLADFDADVPANGSHSTALSSDLSNAGRPIESPRQYHVLIQLARTFHERYQYCSTVKPVGLGETKCLMREASRQSQWLRTE